MAADNTWPGDSGPGRDGREDPGGGPYDPGVPGTAPGGDGACGPGTVPESIGADGNWRTAAPGECIGQDEFNRRVNLNIQNNPGNPGSGGNNAGGGGPQAPSGPARFPFEPVPQFNGPEFTWDEVWKAPTLEEASKEPGYAFAADEGRRALEQSAAAKGVLRTGGTLKDILGWGNKFAEQNYGNAFDRQARSYQTRFDTAASKHGFNYQLAKDKYAPNLLGWQTRTAFGTNAAQRAWEQSWAKYFDDTLGADEIFRAGQPR